MHACTHWNTEPAYFLFVAGRKEQQQQALCPLDDFPLLWECTWRVLLECKRSIQTFTLLSTCLARRHHGSLTSFLRLVQSVELYRLNVACPSQAWVRQTAANLKCQPFRFYSTVLRCLKQYLCVFKSGALLGLALRLWGKFQTNSLRPKKKKRCLKVKFHQAHIESTHLIPERDSNRFSYHDVWLEMFIAMRTCQILLLLIKIRKRQEYKYIQFRCK